MPTLNDSAPLTAIGWRGGVPDSTTGGHLARVVVQHRNGYRVHDGTDEFGAQPAPRFLRRDVDPVDRPGVGDFVLLGATPPRIEQVLPRRSLLVRAAAGERHRRQIIAANVDTVFVLMGLDGDFNPRRVERYLALIGGSGAVPVVVLTKLDKVEPAASEALRAELDAVVGDVEVHAINAKDTTTLAPLRAHLRPGDTAVLVGSSGAGKSTLTNTLLGIDKHATAAVRAHDSRGRHTTTHRALIQLPGGACLIDTPGMRELKLTGDEELTQGNFSDIETLALDCRFGDCAHGSEPDCAVRAALESGALDAARWQAWLKLRDEVAVAGDALEAQLKRKAHARVQDKSLGRRLIDKYGRR
jgi:ribosome biogenesis GTPase